MLVDITAAFVKLKPPKFARILSDTAVAIQLFQATSSNHAHVTRYYVAVVQSDHPSPSSEVSLDDVRYMQMCIRDSK